MVEYPVIADIDGDGHANIVIAANSYYMGSYYGIRAFSSPKNDWIGTRKIWNQHAYYITNIGNNGQAIRIDKKNIWSKWVTSEHLLGFRNNLPIRPYKEICN